MPSWGELLEELQQSSRDRGGGPNLDGVRRKYLKKLNDLTGRPTIIYYSDWLGKGGPLALINLEDMQGMMEVCRDLKGPCLDIILHSPGGSPEAVAGIVHYLREQFSDIRVFVPLAAMSAATMWSLAGNVVVMGKHSQLGPIDPQMLLPDGRQAPADAILRQFEKAKEECRDPALLGAWVPILQMYGPALLEQCKAAKALAKGLVQKWLTEYMFHGESDADSKAKSIAKYFADYDKHRSHSRGIYLKEARDQGVKIAELEDNQELQDAVLTVHHAAMHTFQGLAIKIVENHLGRAFIKLVPPPPTMMPLQFPLPQGLRLPGDITPGFPGAPPAPGKQ